MKLITDYLDDTAARYPDKTAVLDKNGATSFRTLRGEARAIGTQLARRGLQRQPVVVWIDKSARTLSAFMGVAYSGNFYTPVDAVMPPDRMRSMIQTLGARVLITQQKYAQAVRETLQFDGTVLVYEELISEDADDTLLSAVYARACSADLLYVLFTSGSTGQPKGVSVPHAAVLNFAEAFIPLYNITQEDIFGTQAAFYFDLSVTDIACMLKAGATLYLLDADLFAQPVELLKALRDNRVTAIAWVPSALVLVARLRALQSVDVSKTLRKVLFIGEVMPAKTLNTWRVALPQALFSNYYGPTEACVACTAYIVDRDIDDDESVPIGTPLANYDVFLLDENDALVTGEREGEICVRGASVARGYYNNPEMTRRAFVQNPLQTAVPETIYRTGDWARYNERGELLYIGRKDFQIKHLGHRIELGDIEAAAAALPEIGACGCVYDTKRTKLVLFAESAADKQQLAAELQKRLPQYMCPNRIILMEHIPLNNNGKIDRTALKAML